MSKVYSFRLNLNNPREAQAIATINELDRKGYSLRQIVVNALLQSEENPERVMQDMEFVLEQLSEMMNQIKDVQNTPNDNISQLSEGFLKSIKTSAKSGVILKPK